jgi:hypothetical protein
MSIDSSGSNNNNKSNDLAELKKALAEAHEGRQILQNPSTKKAIENDTTSFNTSKQSSSNDNLLIFSLFFVVILGLVSLLYYSQSNKVDYEALQGKPASILFTKDVIKNQVSKWVGYGNEGKLSYFLEVASPKDALKKEGVYLVGTGCMPHDCYNSQGLIFVNTQTNDVVVVTTIVNENTFTSYGMDYNSKNKSFNKVIPPSAQRWLRKQNIIFK